MVYLSSQSKNKTVLGLVFTLVRTRGLEPPQPCGHYDLNVARLPIPPCPREITVTSYLFWPKNSSTMGAVGGS